MRGDLKKVMLVAVPIVVVAALLIAFTLPRPQPAVHRFSFEEGMEGWVAAGTDLEHAGGTLEWSIERTQEMAKDGSASVRVFLNNANDAGKIWIQRAFELPPERSYSVEVSYALASLDCGAFNLWTIITGVLEAPPSTREDLVPAFQGYTGNGQECPSDYVWLDKSYVFEVEKVTNGELWVVIGVWGTWETSRTYFIDEVQVVITPLG